MRLGGKSSPNAYRESDFSLPRLLAHHRREGQIIDLRIRAPILAAADADLELARQVVEIGIVDQQLRHFVDQWRRVAKFMRVQSCQRAARYVSRDIAAGRHRGQTAVKKCLQHVRKIFDCDPMKLYVLAHGNVRNASGIPFREPGNSTQLGRVDKAIGQTDAKHEVRRGAALATDAAYGAGAVTLRINTPPAEIGLDPGVRNG